MTYGQQGMTNRAGLLVGSLNVQSRVDMEDFKSLYQEAGTGAAPLTHWAGRLSFGSAALSHWFPQAFYIPPGSGGTRYLRWNQDVATGGSWSGIIAAVNLSEQRKVNIPKSPSELIAELRATFSLNVTETATVLHVERPTIYSWVAERSVPNAENYRRLKLIHRFIRRWNSLSNRPVGILAREPIDDRSLVDLLGSEPLEEAAVGARLRHLARLVAPAGPRALRKRTEERIRESGLDKQDLEKAGVGVDWLTGRRSGPE